MDERHFLNDVQTLRHRARQHIEQGAATAGHGVDLRAVLELLNDSLATETVFLLRYRCHHLMTKGTSSKGIAEEFLVHAQQEQRHADRIAERIAQLGGEPDFSPHSPTSRSHSEPVQGASLEDGIIEDLVAERVAIDTYRDIIRYLGDRDPTTRRLLEEMVALEEEHADALADLLGGLPTKMAAARDARPAPPSPWRLQLHAKVK
jgi:bacterioferritin